MNLIKAIEAMESGKKITKASWSDGKYVEYYKDDDCFFDNTGKNYYFQVDSIGDLEDDDYEIWGDSILNEKEKEYLSNIIKPFKDYYEIIIVKEYITKLDNSFIRITLTNNEGSDTIKLPKFTPEDHIYDGMKYSIIYHPEELGL